MTNDDESIQRLAITGIAFFSFRPAMKAIVLVILLIPLVLAQVDPISTYTTTQFGDGTYYGAVSENGTCTLDNSA